VLFAEAVKVTVTYEEIILGGTIGPRFERGNDRLQSGTAGSSAAFDERTGDAAQH